MLWMSLVFLYALIKGAREILKKKALERNTVIEVLFAYTLFSFLLVTPEVTHAFVIGPKDYLMIALKSLVIFIAWICGFNAINRMPVSMYGILDMARVIFAMVLGMLVFKEVLGAWQWVGFGLVLLGLMMLRIRSNKAGGSVAQSEKVPVKYVIMAFLSCFFNAVSGTMDKSLTKTIDDGVLQFWYMLFLVLYYAIYILVTRTHIRWKLVFKNYWIYILSVIFMIGDRALFIANAIPDSKVTVMTLIKQSCCIVTILMGRFILKEKDTLYRLMCALVVIGGILVAMLL